MRVLIVAAHPDDEVLGCGGAIALHCQRGDEVSVVFMADGEGARSPDSLSLAVEKRREAAREASKILGALPPVFNAFPDNRMDEVGFLDLVQQVEKRIELAQPQRIYTHHGGDLNIDHRLTYQAVVTACRPVPGALAQEIFSFEVPSSTEWAAQGEYAFRPTAYVEVTPVLRLWEKALACYEEELHPFPHARSMDALKSRSSWRGATYGVTSAEVFMIERMQLDISGENSRVTK